MNTLWFFIPASLFQIAFFAKKSSARGNKKHNAADGNKRQSCNRFESERRRERQKKKNELERALGFFSLRFGGLSLWEQIRVCASFFLSGDATKKPITSVSIAPVNAARPLWLRFMELLQRTKSYNHSQKRNCGAEGRHSYAVVSCNSTAWRVERCGFLVCLETNQYPAAAISK